VSELLDRIDRAVDGLCPCGAEPTRGSAYCSDDCTPTHIAGDTDPSGPGEHGAQSTPMRWRPDLVTAVDDGDLTDLGSNTFYEGRHHAQLFERNASTWHLRLDDGHRFVGADLGGVGLIDDELKARVAEKWAALERELGNSRHLERDTDPWADVFTQAVAAGYQAVGGEWIRTQLGRTPHSEGDRHGGWRRYCVHCRQRSLPREAIRATPTPPVAWTLDCGTPGQPGDMLVETETCHVCASCERPFPGPALLVMRIDRREADLTEYQMRLGNRKSVLRVYEEDLVRQRQPEAWLQHRLERMEQELLIAYGHANPDRPDVVEWVEACNANARREEQRHLQMVGPLVLDPQAARSLFQNLNLT
jgi:NAD-dependent dihydropyrimidine dehydrogenase PreA subunit